MRYTTDQWRAFAVLVVVNAGVALLVVSAGTVAIVVYAVVIPMLFRLLIVASADLKPVTAVRAIAVWRALRRHEVVMYFQARVALDSGSIEGAEALARWEHPRRGVLPPAQWLPVVDQFRWLERRFCRYTLHAAGCQARAWRDAGKDLYISVNVSPYVFTDDDLVHQVREMLDEWDLPPVAIEIEVTEQALEFSATSGAVAHELAAMGVALALDDFGTGQSSMKRLVELPFRVLKIDRSFVTDMIADDMQGAVVRSACNLAQSMGITVVAEGIETVAVMEALNRIGCDAGQGYLFNRPLPASAFDTWIQDNEVEALAGAGSGA